MKNKKKETLATKKTVKVEKPAAKKVEAKKIISQPKKTIAKPAAKKPLAKIEKKATPTVNAVKAKKVEVKKNIVAKKPIAKKAVKTLNVTKEQIIETAKKTAVSEKEMLCDSSKNSVCQEKFKTLIYILVGTLGLGFLFVPELGGYAYNLEFFEKWGGIKGGLFVAVGLATVSALVSEVIIFIMQSMCQNKDHNHNKK